SLFRRARLRPDGHLEAPRRSPAPLPRHAPKETVNGFPCALVLRRSAGDRPPGLRPSAPAVQAAAATLRFARVLLAPHPDLDQAPPAEVSTLVRDPLPADSAAGPGVRPPLHPLERHRPRRLWPVVHLRAR